MNSRRSQYLIGMVVAGTMALAGCGSSSSGPSDGSATPATPTAEPSGEPVKIGVINQENETIAFPEGSAAARATVAYLNAENGGIDGRPIEMVLCTTGDSAESAVACANQFANDPSVPLVINMSYNTAAVNEILVGRTALLTWNLDIPDMTTPDLFAVEQGIFIPIQVVAKILEREGAANVSLLYSDSIEEFLVPPAEAALAANGITVVRSVPVATGGDFTSAVTAADLGEVDAALMLLVDPAQCSGVGRVMQGLGVTVPVVSVDVCSAVSTVETGNVDGWQFAVTNTGGVDPSVAGPDTIEFRRVLETYSDGELNLGTTAGLAYAYVLAAADIYSTVGVDNLSASSINQLLSTGWSYTPPTYVPMACPGEAPFIGLCVNSMWELVAVDSRLELAQSEPVVVDMSIFADLVS